jgi:hypothetical protein
MRARSGWLALLAALVLSSCVAESSASTAPGAASKPEPIAADLLPAEMGGLTVAPEDVRALVKKAGPESYLASTRLWGLRTGERLRATVQVGRFVADADPANPDFRLRIVGQIGQAAARRRVLHGQDVYVTASNEQALYVWFRGRALVVLSVASDFTQPRRVLREALELQP